MAEVEKSAKLKEAERKPEGAKKPAEKKPEERAELIAELRSLNARTLPGRAEDPIVEPAEEERKLEEILPADGEADAPPAMNGMEIFGGDRSGGSGSPGAACCPQIRYIGWSRGRATSRRSLQR